MKTILQLADLPKFLPIDGNINICDIHQLKRIELKEFKDCLGTAFYNHLLTCLADYTKAKKWVEDEAVVVGDVRVYKDCPYIAIADSDGVIPSNIECWKKAGVFKEKCSGVGCTDCNYNEFYCDYLGVFLALSLMKQRLPYIRNKITSDGVVKIKTDDYEAVSSASYESLRIQINSDISLTYNLMVDYMKMNNSTGCYNLFKGIAVGCCGDCGCSEPSCVCEDDCGSIKEEEDEYNIC